MTDLSELSEAELLAGVAATSKDELARMGEMMVVNTQAQILAENPGIPLAVIRAMMRQQFMAALVVLNDGKREEAFSRGDGRVLGTPDSSVARTLDGTADIDPSLGVGGGAAAGDCAAAPEGGEAS